jgi:hypothetical protein
MMMFFLLSLGVEEEGQEGLTLHFSEITLVTLGFRTLTLLTLLELYQTFHLERTYRLLILGVATQGFLTNSCKPR